MYSVILMTALVSTTATPGWHRGGCYCAPPVQYSCGCYSGCGGYPVQGYGFAGGCYGYHGGCYGAFGNTPGNTYGFSYGDPHRGFSVGCYGCYGGHSGYGVPVPVGAGPKAPVIVDPFPPINPKKDDKGGAEEIGPLKEKKKDDKKPEGSVRAKIRIEVPEGGKLFVDGKHIAVAAGTRFFQTPALAPGQAYYYDIRIEVVRNGVTRGEEQRVVVQPGQDAFVHFPTLRPPDALAAQGESQD